MELNLKRPIVFFDLETTGVDPAKDRIVEISMVKIMPGWKTSVCWVWSQGPSCTSMPT